MAPLIATQLAPDASQRAHAYAYEVTGLIQLPLVAVTVRPMPTFPLTDGETELIGHAPGVTEFESADGRPVPAEFVAVTVNVYAVPFVKPLTVAEVVLPLTVADTLPGDEVTVYDVIDAPPLEVGADQLTEACPLPAVAPTLVGAPGGPIGVTMLEGDDAALVPAELVAVSVKV